MLNTRLAFLFNHPGSLCRSAEQKWTVLYLVYAGSTKGESQRSGPRRDFATGWQKIVRPSGSFTLSENSFSTNSLKRDLCKKDEGARVWKVVSWPEGYEEALELRTRVCNVHDV